MPYLKEQIHVVPTWISTKSRFREFPLTPDVLFIGTSILYLVGAGATKHAISLREENADERSFASAECIGIDFPRGLNPCGHRSNIAMIKAILKLKDRIHEAH